MRILTVCLGNICRSPLAASILSKKFEDAGIECSIDSCGTAAYHEGEMADPLSIQTADEHGIDIREHRARQFEVADFDRFDLILVMDRQNYSNVLMLATDQEQERKVRMMLGGKNNMQGAEVPDPYYGGPDGFERVYQMLDIAADRIVEEVMQNRSL